MAVPLFHVDAFTSTPFSGNPAAVCLLEGPADDHWMQAVATEMNLSETAFVHPSADGFGLRWFTPTTEVELCGHATLAGAHTLWETGRLEPTATARFHTRSRGELRATRTTSGVIELDFPSDPPETAPLPDGMAATLDVDPRATARAGVGFLVEVATTADVRAVRPDFTRMARLESVIVTSASSSETDDHDFVSRYFAPRYGIDEDPVTGAAHCALAPYWAERVGRRELRGYQASARGGTVAMRLHGDRVVLGGDAVTVARGELAV